MNDNFDHPGSLDGAVALVTGGAGGAGRAAALAFAGAGADVAIVYRNDHQAAAETRDRIEALGRACLVLPADLRLDSECRRAASRVRDRFGRLDLLALCHAAGAGAGRLLDITAQELEDTFQTNALSYLTMIQAALPLMERGSAVLATITGEAAPGRPDHSAAAGAVAALVPSLSAILEEEGLRVNGLSLGGTPAEDPPEALGRLYLGLALAPVTGQILRAQGGQSLFL